MDATWNVRGEGFLPEAARRLSTVSAGLVALESDTAWECRAADEYRATLAALVRRVDALREVAASIESDVRAARARAAATGAW